MNRLHFYRVAAAVACLALLVSAAEAGDLLGNPLHNYSNPYDVDGSSSVTPRDLLLVVDKLNADQADPLTAQVAASEQYYWDTTNNGSVTPRDALWVINYLLTPPTQVPEPGSIVTGGLALLGLAGLCWRQTRRRRRS